MSVPTAVAPSVLTPGLYLTVDLLAGAASPGTGTLKVALLASQSSAGDMTNDTEVREGGGAASASTAFGPGTPGHLAAKLLYGAYQQAQVDFVAPAPGSGSASLDVTLTGAPTGNTAVRLDIMGRVFDVAWLAGQTADTAKASIIAAVNERTSDLFVTASSGGSGVVTLTAKIAGNIGEDVLVKAVLTAAQTGTETVDNNTHTALSGGSSDPDLTTALASLAGEEYAFILLCLSNTDVANVGSANNVSKAITHINAYNSGLEAKLQQVVTAYTGAQASAEASTPHANSFNNDPAGHLMYALNGRGLPAELAGLEVGQMLAAHSLDPAANRIGASLSGYYGAADVIADKPTAAEAESALGAGVSIVSYDAGGSPYVMRPITTHSQDSAGGADYRVLDVQHVVGTYIVARDMRSAFPQEFAGAKIVADIAAGEDPPPKNVIEVRDVKAFGVTRLRFWERQGVVTKASIDQALADESMIFQINATDATQLDIVMPFKIVPPLAKTGLVVQRVPN